MGDAGSPLIDAVSGNNATISGSVTYSQTGGLNDGTGSKAVAWTSGMGTAAGADTALNFERTNSFTIEVFIKPNVTRSGGLAEYDIVDKELNSGTYRGINFELLWDGSKTVVFGSLTNTPGSNEIKWRSSTDLANGTWYHIVWTYDGSSTVAGNHVYVNGTEETKTNTGNNLSATILNASDVQIGARGGTNYMKGTMQELAVYNSVLSSASIQSHASYINSTALITSFNFASPSVTGTINNTPSPHTVALTVPYGTDVTNLTPTIAVSNGATVSPTSGTAENFSSPQTYTVTAQDGVTTQQYTVTVGSNTILGLTTPIPVMYETDIGGDIDDVYDMYTMSWLQRLGQVNLLGVSVGTNVSYGAALADTILRYANPNSTVPIGAWQGAGLYSTDLGSYVQNTVTHFGLAQHTTLNTYPDCRTVYRQALNSAANASVVLFNVGTGSCIKRLMQSADGDDGVSGTGMALISAKVKMFIWSAGRYPSGSEYNFTIDLGGSYVTANWPTSIPIYFIGQEQTEGVPTMMAATSLQTNEPQTNPLAYADNLWHIANGGAAGCYAYSAPDFMFMTSNGSFSWGGYNGTNAVNASTGANSWTQTPNANQSWLTRLLDNSVYVNWENGYLYTSFYPVISSIASSTTTTTASITWTTDIAADSQVDYGLTSGYGNSSTLDSTTVTSHSVALTALSPLTTYHFRVKSTNSTSSDQTFTTASAGLPTATGVSISGTPTVGQTVTGLYTFSDPNGKTELGTTYQWSRASSSGGSYSPIGGATAITYVLTSTDIGQYIKFQVTPVSASGTGSASPSSATTQIQSSGVPTASTVSVSGTVTEGQTLTGNYTYAQADSVAQGVSTFRWLESATSGGVYSAIGGATANTYALAPADVGKYIKFEVTPVASFPPTSGVAQQSSNVGPVVASSLPVASAVSYTGTETVGQILTGVYTYTDSGSHAQTTSTFRWLRSDTVNGTYSAISSATAQTYTLVSADIGKYIKFEVTPVSTVATGVTVVSNPAGQINSSAVPTASAVAISGTADVAQVLTGSYIYAQADGVAEGATTFRWLESGTADGTYFAITGATNSTYTVTTSDQGMYIKFEVTPVATTPPSTGLATLSSATAQVPLPVVVTVSHSGGGGGCINCWVPPFIPTGGFNISINQNASTTPNRIVTLNFNAKSDIKKIAISMTGDFSDASQENYSDTRQWDLCSKFGGLIINPTCPNGKYIVYAKFYTASGIASSVALSSITLTTGATNTTTSTPAKYNFTRNLSLHATGKDVKALQQYLNASGFVIAKTGAGSLGKETTLFGTLTYKALVKFQKSIGWSGTGFFGPMTREYIANH